MDNNHQKYLREKPLHGKLFCQQEEIPLCCLCCKESKTTLHIDGGCEMLAGTKYTEQHNKIYQ
eukprot:14546657-Ditylum_brightwellii.AAC.1